jgi:hypothetical protein
MSDLIKTAIADAKALSELAVRKAEERMITKHGPAVKKAVGNLLEQGEPGQVPTEEDFSDEDFFADLDAEMSPGEASTPLAPTLSAQIPQGS